MKLRYLLPAAVMLLAEPLFAQAESPMPDPIAPAVIGRPLEQIRPAPRVRDKPVAAQPAPARPVATRPAAAAPKTAAAAVAPAPQAQAPQIAGRAPKQAVDDRADPRMRLDDVGQGTQLARKPLGTGAYIGERHRVAVRKYYEQHPGPAATAKWRVGEPLPRRARLAAVPPQVLASLPKEPPGYRYVQLGGEVVLIAADTRMVVDGISREGG